MPSPPKERPSGRLGRLLAALRPSRAGPLPVQTGFPTSLADLVVKNHGRLKKQPSPSTKRGKRGAATAAASPTPSVPPSPSPSPSPPPASPPPTAAVGISPSDRPRPDLPPARRGKGRGGFALGLGFLAVSGVVSLALLVIWSKKVVAAVTAASFSLFLLESVRSSLRPRRPRPAAAERRICLDGRGRVSPIREVDAEETEPPRPSCSDTDRGSEASILAAEEKSVCGALDESSTPKAKKRSWKKKLIASAKKLNKGRKSKEADSPASLRRDGDPADASARRSNASAADPSDSRRRTANRTGAAVAAVTEPDSLRGSRRSSEGVEEIVAAAVEIDDAPSVALIAEEEEEAEEEEGGGAGSRSPAGLVLVAIVLVGLVAGKVPAVALTVLCYAFLSSVQGLPRGGGGPPGRRLEEASSSSLSSS